MVRCSGVWGILVWSTMSLGADSPAKVGTICGRLVDVEGRPVAGGSIWGMSRQTEVGRVQADAEGRFRLGPLGVDKPVDVWFEGGGLALERREDIHVFEGRDHDLGALTLVPGTRIVGRVVDVEGRPVAGSVASIDVYRRILGHTISSNQAQWEVMGDAEGRFRTVSLPAGEAEMMIAAPGKVRRSVGRPTIPGLAEVDLGDVKLETEIPIRGVVVDQDGQPAPKVEIVADYDHKNPVITDEKGHFTVGGTGKDAKELFLTSNDYFAPKPFPIGPDRDHLRLPVRRAYTILGSAVDAETGGPVTVATVRLCMVTHEPDGTTSLRG